MSGAVRPGRNFLFVPGPTNLPESVLRAMHVVSEDHRAPDFPEFTKPLFEDLKKVFKSKDGQAFIFPSSGTGAWETAITNTLSPGDKVLAPRFGNFSHLWIELTRRHGIEVIVQEEEWGTGANPSRIEEALTADKDHQIKAVLIVHNETATGVTSDVAAVRAAIAAANHPALLFVDGVSSIGSIDFRMDEWGVDMAVCGSQKGLMLPAGLGILCASQKALSMREDAKCARAYFNLDDQIRSNRDGYFPYTPAVGLLHGLRASMDRLFDEGLENVFARHRHLAGGVRAAAEAWGLSLCAKEPKWYSDTVSAIMVPEGIDGSDVIRIAYERYNLSLGAGLSQVAGKLFRIGHLGDLNELMLLGALSGAEMAMQDAGIGVELGSGVAAAQAHFRGELRPKETKIAAE
ncbi:aminotransferase class V-fold PLP-dependent enzyme [Methyloligella sp. 2.7D]|uniref:aminotransferase class V-fold PLP-dependent enzyme n=1 Tax=unclassified Methyloligella TaxID=2625955 RepID=UPI00157D751A|nr:aminotransferase class V-fold PLP-dependent enzyme [Methyloligella sp. GL2]QKP76483.1 aminotransferase class V-fold PLP-dependent enzyme [Methyloligella sp. GL2]